MTPASWSKDVCESERVGLDGYQSFLDVVTQPVEITL
jgi:hypothetical protein